MDDIETICANSYRNFHCRGFDYLCLSRTPELTRKVYFFEGELHHLPELVMPHDHRYAFVTTVLAGSVSNNVFEQVDYDPTEEGLDEWEQRTRPYDHFEYRTPLNGGDGFEWVGEKRMRNLTLPNGRRRGESWRSSADAIHTLQLRAEGSVILLEQLEDELPVGVPTNAYRKAGDRTPPSLDGLYEGMTPDHARMRLNQFLDLVGNR